MTMVFGVVFGGLGQPAWVKRGSASLVPPLRPEVRGLATMSTTAGSSISHKSRFPDSFGRRPMAEDGQAALGVWGRVWSE
jgi:hypothetical protein